MDIKFGLSKSGYCKGLQCPKILWLDQNKPDVADQEPPAAVLATGNMVGELARQYFGDCSLVEFSPNKEEMAVKTQSLMASEEENIAEAAFLIDGLYCAVDILHKNGDGWDIVEVKSSTKVEDVYIDDMSFQYYVLNKCGVSVKRIYNMHIDNTYVRHGELDLQGLFTLEDCTDAVMERQADVSDNIEGIKSYIVVEEEPVKDIDICCDNPYRCAYYGYCRKHLPEHSVFDLARMQIKKKYQLYHKGIVSYEDVLHNKDCINENQLRQVESIYYHREDEYKIEEIRAFLDTLTYPIYHLDFETFQMAVPEYEGTSPYQQIPFQYSLHIEYEDGTLDHKEFLAKEGQDPRRELAERLIEDIPMDACPVAYNMSFERTVILHLAEAFPDLSEHLLNIRENMHDLMVPFQKQHYYSAMMQGSYSIKYVLPALWPGDPELDYHNLEGVHNGSEASAAFADMVNHSPEEIAIMRENLLKYCWLDTYAMVKVLRKLKEIAG